MSDAYKRLSKDAAQPWNWRDASVLFVSYGWDPALNAAETLAGRRLVAALLDAGAHVNVLARNRADREFDSGDYRVTVIPTRPFPSNRVARAAHMVRSTIPEAEGSWVDVAVDAGVRALASMPSDTVIYGRAMPGASNIVAWRLGRLTGRPWVAHFSDEWPAPQVLSRGRRWLAPYKAPLFRWWRRRIVRDAGGLTFTNPHQAEHFVGADGVEHLPKAFVVTHLGSAPAPAAVDPQFNTFHLVHTGNFYPPGHSSAALIGGLQLFLQRTPAAWSHCRLTQAGWSDGDMPEWVAHCGLNSIVRFAGRVAPSELGALLQSASLLIGIDYSRPDSRTILSKLPDYMAARRPILAITAASSAMGRFFDEDNAGLTARYDSPEEVAGRIAAVYGAWRDRTPAFLPGPRAIDAFSRGRVLSELGGAFTLARAACTAIRERPRAALALTSGQLAE